MTTSTAPNPFSEPSTAPLSPAGVARRDAILSDLTSLLVARRRRRVALRAASIAVPICALAAAAATMLAPRPQPKVPEATSPVAAAQPSPTPDASPAPSRIEVVRADDSVLARLTVASDAPSRIQHVSDADLLATLRESGEDVGLIRTDKSVALVANTVH